MFAAAPSIKSVCLPLKHWAVLPGNDAVKRAMRALVQRLNTVLQGRAGLVKATDALHDELFALRLRALGHLAATDEPDLLAAMDRVAKEWKDKAKSEAMELLLWNMEFAVSVQRELLHSMKTQGMALNTDSAAQLAAYRSLTFTELMALVPALVPNPQAAEVLTTWLRASMRMELALLMADAVLNGEVQIGAKRLHALNSMLVRAAQEYGACAALMGLISSLRQEPVFLAAEQVPPSYRKEQKELAEQGIGDWFKAWA